MSAEDEGAPPPKYRHPSLEKTEPCVPRPEDFEVKGEAALPAGDVPPVTEIPLSDFDALRHELIDKSQACAALTRANDELKVMIDALRSDHSAQLAERQLELAALREGLQKAHDEQLRILDELERERQANKALKSQALGMQHQMTAWGIPVSAAGPNPGAPPGAACSFPAVLPLEGAPDPVPTILRGDLLSFHLADILHVLASSRLQGVLTLITGELASKLYVERKALRLVAWSNPDSELQLASMLEDSGLVPGDVLAEAKLRFQFDLELARGLAGEGLVSSETIRLGLEEHAKVILGYLLHAKSGQFFFQPGRIEGFEGLQFKLPITSVLLTAAAAADEQVEKKRVGSRT